MSKTIFDPAVTRSPRAQRLRALWSRTHWTLSQRWFLLFSRDATLFLTLLVASFALISPKSVWTLWLPLPLVFVACVQTQALSRGFVLRWSHLGRLGLFFFPLFGRALLSLNGPIPVAGLREAQELAVVFFVASGLWLIASREPARTLCVWTAAALALWMLNGFPWLSPNFMVTVPTVFWGAALWLWLRLPARVAGPAGPSPRPADPFLAPARRPWTGALLGLILFILGLWLGGLCFLHQRSGSLYGLLSLEAGLRAQEVLWIQSLLFGWGHGTLDRLITVLAEPVPAAVSGWGGPLGLLALGGLAGVAVLLLWALMLGRQLYRSLEGPPRKTLLLPAVLAAFFLIGLLVTGGPRSGLILFSLAGWIALAMADPSAEAAARPRRRPQPAPGILPTLVVAAPALVLIVILTLPTLGTTLFRRATRAKTRGEAYRDRLYQAQWLNPFDPEIPLALAESFRAEVADPHSQQPINYLHVVRLYREAEALDPYDPDLPIALAQFQLQSDRQEDAIETARKALALRPNSQALMEWTYQTALGLNLDALAYEMLDRGLCSAPTKVEWWQRQYALARRLGEGPLASQSQAIALTADPDQHDLLRETR